MRFTGLLALSFLVAGVSAPGQVVSPTVPPSLNQSQTPPAPSPGAASLPDSPGVYSLAPPSIADRWFVQNSLDFELWSSSLIPVGDPSTVLPVRATPLPCTPASRKSGGTDQPSQAVLATPRLRPDCPPEQNPLKPFVTGHVEQLSPRGKALLAYHDLVNPANFLTVAANSAISVGSDAHSAYGPGLVGFGRNAGVTLAGEVTAEVVGTWAVSSLVHQDPRYFRMPGASPFRRIVHAVAHVAIAQSDRGRPMPNFANFFASYVDAELSNLYVPGLNTNQPSTNARIWYGFLSEPIGNLIDEFLPDLAGHIHIRAVVVQQYINRLSAPGTTIQP